MDKKSLTEADIHTKFITAALVGADGAKGISELVP
jgi:hypothetical protein